MQKLFNGAIPCKNIDLLRLFPHNLNGISFFIVLKSFFVSYALQNPIININLIPTMKQGGWTAFGYRCIQKRLQMLEGPSNVTMEVETFLSTMLSFLIPNKNNKKK